MSFLWSLADTGEDDIDRQMIWYESDESHGGAVLANRWSDLLRLALDKLALSPHRHGFAPESGKWMPQYEIRQMLFRPWKTGVGWRVLYTIDEARKLVTILQIRHEHRRWLFEAEDDES
ncbi:MAG: type II toxin-antitoxin system RelE family toxin [Prosthecobacter sp.]|uniref:type II toxin-antitoxin system RelE family toxin n=1 Tax=Prosthecobacter sp. TaxID=1965333 RepID=UPI0039006204